MDNTSVKNNSIDFIKDLQAYLLEILLAVNDFCIENNITYYLGEATLLGAIRHKGFIPWDNDVSILMPREDYDKFISLAQISMPEGYYLDCMETNPNYWVVGAKVQITRSTEFSHKKIKKKNLSKYCGPYINVFPLDYVPKKTGLYQLLGCKIKALRRTLLFKTKYSMNFKNKFNIILFLFSKCVSVGYIHNKINSIITKYSYENDHEFMLNYASSYPFWKQTVYKSVYGCPRLQKFEGHDLPVPAEAEYLLKNIYGDFLSLPDESKRVPKHKYIINNNSKSYTKELQAYCLEILLAVNDFCVENNITYYLGEGTLLGAIRHKGFIPWDDDVDILMPREDYDKFISLAQISMPEGYYLDCMETNPNYWVIGAKIKITRPTEFAQNKVKKKNLSKYCGPYIDIFPLDYVPKKTGLHQRILGYKIKALRRILFFKTRYSMNFKNKFNVVLFLFSKCVSVGYIHNKIKSIITKYSKDGNHEYMVNYASYYPVWKQTVHKSVYGCPRFQKFEGYDLPVPAEAEYLLKNIYGDFLSLPDESKRVAKHKYTVIQDQNV